MDTERIVERLRERLGSIPWNTQTVSLLLLGCFAVVGFVALSNPTPAIPYESLFAGRTLSSSELESMEAALGVAELTGYVVENREILVPRDVRSKYIAALQQADCLPGAFHASRTAALNAGNFLESSRKSTAREEHAREQEARALICGISGVDDALVSFDERRGRTFGEGPLVTAVVGVRTPTGQPLDVQAYRTIQTTLLGFKVGLQPENITITDIHARRSIRGEINPDSPEVVAIARESLTQRWRQRVANELNFLPNAKVDVNVVPDEWGTSARVVQVSVAVPNDASGRGLRNAQQHLDEIRSQVRAALAAVLPKPNGQRNLTSQDVSVSWYEVPVAATAKNTAWTRLRQRPALLFLLLTGLCASAVVLLTNSTGSNAEPTNRGLRVVSDQQTMHDEAVDENVHDESTSRLRAFVKDDPEAAARSLSTSSIEQAERIR